MVHPEVPAKAVAANERAETDLGETGFKLDSFQGLDMNIKTTLREGARFAPVCATCKEISQMLQISEATVRQYASREVDPLPRFKYPGQKSWRYDVRDVLAWHERNKESWYACA